MADLRLHLKLERCTGVLAGIVASLSRNGVELISQRIEADQDGGRGGVLALHALGRPPDVDALVERLGGARGVERVTWVEVDGETVLSEPEALADPIGAEDLARLSAGAESPSGLRSSATGADADAADNATTPPPEADGGRDLRRAGAPETDPEPETRDSGDEVAGATDLPVGPKVPETAAGEPGGDFGRDARGSAPAEARADPEPEAAAPAEGPGPIEPAPRSDASAKRRTTSLRRRRRRRL